jgi:hypothetical protein
MRGLATIPIRTRSSVHSGGVREGVFPRPRNMRNVRRDRSPRRPMARWVKGGERINPSAPSPSPLSSDLLITTRVLELSAADAQERRDRQIAAVARLLRRAAGSQGAPGGSRDGDD